MQRISKTRASLYSTLKTRKGRRREGLFIVQGEKAVRDTLPFFVREAVIMLSGAPVPDFVTEDCELLEATESEMKKISTLNELPRMIAVYRIPDSAGGVENVDRDRFHLALDGVSDPGNFGTIIRTAHWFGVDTIYCGEGCPDLFNPKVVQSTMGSLARVRVVYCDLPTLFDANRELPVYGLLLNGKDIFAEKKFSPGFILMGNEGHGISEGVIPYVSHPLTIPPSDASNHPDSLNVAIATAVTLAQMVM